MCGCVYMYQKIGKSLNRDEICRAESAGSKKKVGSSRIGSSRISMVYLVSAAIGRWGLPQIAIFGSKMVSKECSSTQKR